MRDKAFFFVNLQLLRAYDTALVTRTVYTQAARQGCSRYVVGRANAPGDFDPRQSTPAEAPPFPLVTARTRQSPVHRFVQHRD